MGFRFGVRVRPGARRAAVGGRWSDGALVVAVAAPAVEGKANEAVRRALAAAFGVRGRDVVIVTGERGRDKVVELAPAPPNAADTLDRLLDAGS
ncbi:DUF167 domain-containing protein [Actinokineospora enzanensis]|uniref:DUF167 domain-containing protein n=1 Tax=Actinokineospora enzanensis TaxID=155975 RepID=UPI00037B16D2|nr:DUF167 domain-containing protein [Actinokineospora enzanensis]